jgi:cytochrome P450
MTDLPGPVEPDFKDDPAIDPYPEYARLRAQCPVGQVAKASGVRPFLVTRYQDAKVALGDPRLVKDPQRGLIAVDPAGPGTPRSAVASISISIRNMLTTDPPDHTRLRKVVSAEFTPQRTAALRPRIQQLTDGLIDAFAPRGSAEFMRDFANQLPALVIAELLGVPAEDRERFQTWAQDFLRPTEDPAQQAAIAGLSAYLDREIERKRSAPGDDLISSLITSRAEDRLTDTELHGTAFLLMIAGHETTVHLLGNGLLALLQHPEQLTLLRARPELIPDAVEELLRYDSPVERTTSRYSAAQVELGGTVIPENSMILVALGSVNRDEAEYPDPDRLDVTRVPRRHLAFGHGIHFCLGAPLARLEAQIAFETLLRRLPGLELAVPAEELTRRPSFLVRGLNTLPVTFTVQV